MVPASVKTFMFLPPVDQIKLLSNIIGFEFVGRPVQCSVCAVCVLLFSIMDWICIFYFLFFVATQENVWAKSYFWAFFSTTV